MKIKVDQLTDQIKKSLQEYNEEIERNVDKSKRKVAQEGAKELRSTSTVNPYGSRSGKYRKGWTATKVGTAYVIRNRTDYQLTHLLEKGHALRQGGRSPAIPHIYPVEQSVIKKYLEDVKKVIKR